MTNDIATSNANTILISMAFSLRFTSKLKQMIHIVRASSQIILLISEKRNVTQIKSHKHKTFVNYYCKIILDL